MLSWSLKSSSINLHLHYCSNAWDFTNVTFLILFGYCLISSRKPAYSDQCRHKLYRIISYPFVRFQRKLVFLHKKLPCNCSKKLSKYTYHIEVICFRILLILQAPKANTIVLVSFWTRGLFVNDMDPNLGRHVLHFARNVFFEVQPVVCYILNWALTVCCNHLKQWHSYWQHPLYDIRYEHTSNLEKGLVASLFLQCHLLF